jgi:hypothetical protein
VLVIVAAVAAVGCSDGPAPSEPSHVPTRRALVLLDDRGARPMEVLVVDGAGRLADSRPATVDELAQHSHFMMDRIAARPLGEDVLVLWTGVACDKAGTLTVSADGGSITVAPEPIETCELVPSYRGVVLTFGRPRLAGSLRVTLLPTELTGA